MVQFSIGILNRLGAPELSELTVCGARELTKVPDYLSAAIWSHILGVVHRDTSVLHLYLIFLRRTIAASEEYNIGRGNLLRYIEGVKDRKHHLVAYLRALTHFEQCLSSIWQAAEHFNRMEQKVLGSEFRNLALFKKGDKSDLDRINKLHGVSKHFSAQQARKTSTPIWITNTGLKCAVAALVFDELHENILALSGVARQIFVEIPSEVLARKARKGPCGDV